MKLNVYVETTKRRTFAGVLEWPGWNRSGKTEQDALENLAAYADRYAKAMGKLAADLKRPIGSDDLKVAEQLAGNATTEFGAPGVIPAADREPVTDDELEKLLKMLEAARSTFERAASKAADAELQPAGPRGGGRSVDKMLDHVREADGGYVRAVGGKVAESAEWDAVRKEFRSAVFARAHGELPDKGPRGGERWPARYAIRRSAWHALDHAWEIEDRS